MFFAFSEMFSASPSPSFPPIDDIAALARRIDWAAAADRAITGLMIVAAVVQILTARLWAERGRLAPLLRRFAAALIALTDRLPEPLTADAPRAALLAALIAAGHDSPALAKANRLALVARARRAGLIR